MPNIIHRVGIKATPEKIYHALTTDEGLSSWWTTTTHGAGETGSTIHFIFGDDGPKFRVSELIPGKKVVWEHVKSMPDAWEDTQVAFELSQDGEQVFVQFSHNNWKEESEFMAHCSTKWATFLLSLKNAMEQGKGRPYPNDVHIDHSEY